MSDAPNRLRAYRHAAGMTLAEVAAVLKVTESAVSRHETGTRDIGVPTLRAYAKIYCVRVEDLW